MKQIKYYFLVPSYDFGWRETMWSCVSRLKAITCCMTCTYHCEASVVNTSAYSLLLKMCIRDGSSDRCDSKRSSIDWKSMVKQQRDFITKLVQTPFVNALSVPAERLVTCNKRRRLEQALFCNRERTVEITLSCLCTRRDLLFPKNLLPCFIHFLNRIIY